MTRPEGVLDFAVVARALIDVVHGQTDGGTRGKTLENAREDPDLIGLLALGHMARAPGSAPVEVRLDISLGKL